jgi:nucleotide-binding universal stress UspA family protein
MLMREIGVGYDGSPESEHALQAGRRLARQHRSKLSAFEAVSIPAYAFMGGMDGVAIDELVVDAQERVASLEGVEPHAAYGEAAEELALYSASIDLLVIGSRNYGPVGRLIHGSTAQQLARRARCPLLVLPRAARATDTPDASAGAREPAATTSR